MHKLHVTKLSPTSEFEVVCGLCPLGHLELYIWEDRRVCWAAKGWARWTWEDFMGQNLKWHTSSPPRFLWLELSHVTTPTCKGGWEMYSRYVPRKLVRIWPPLALRPSTSTKWLQNTLNSTSIKMLKKQTKKPHFKFQNVYPVLPSSLYGRVDIRTVMLKKLAHS